MNLSFLPKIILEILSNIPTIAFKMVDMKELFHKSKIILKYLSQKNIPLEMTDQIKKNLPHNVSFHHPHKKDELFISSEVDGEDILRIFFSQLKIDGPFFLDLRKEYFAKNKEQDGIIWSPSYFLYEFDHDFKKDLIKLYQNYYGENKKESLRNDLQNLGLMKNLNEEDQEILTNLFCQNFGKDIGAVSFNLKEFQQSFTEIFNFLVERKVELKTDFIFLGVYLTTLFMHLSHSDLEKNKLFDVKKIVGEVF